MSISLDLEINLKIPANALKWALFRTLVYFTAYSRLVFIKDGMHD